MKKIKGLRRPTLKRRGKATPHQPAQRITNETVAAHREEVLARARKYIYPLQHSKHKIVLISTTLVIVAVVAFFSYCLVALYRLQTNSAFVYGVTRVIPFPIARAGGDFVAYENYLFELRHYTHYYETQQKLDFNSEAGQQQLAEFKKRALEKVVNDAYIKKLAAERGVAVSDKEVEEQISIVRNQNRLGGNDQVFEDVLKEFWNWSVDDFKRSLRQQLLAQKLAAALDTETRGQADKALAELSAGADFAAVAKQYSEHAATKDTGGEFGFPIDQTNRDLSAETTAALFKLKPGETSGIINVGYGLEILKNIKTEGDKIRAAHILFNFQDISDYLNPLKEAQPTRLYITP